MPKYPEKVYLMSEDDFICGAGGRCEVLDLELRQYKLKPDNHFQGKKNCLVEWVNIHFGSEEDYSNMDLSLDDEWPSVPDRVYKEVKKATFEVYKDTNVLGFSEGLGYCDILEYLRFDAGLAEDSTPEQIHKAAKEYYESRESEIKANQKHWLNSPNVVDQIIDANDSGTPAQNAEVWNRAMAKLGYVS